MDNYSNLLMDECPPDLRSPEEEIKPAMKKSTTKGVATSFGFRKRSATSPQSPQQPPSCTLTTNNPTAARRLANVTELIPFDSNGNTGDTIGGGGTLATNESASLTSNVAPTGRSTPHRLPAPKKEAQASTKPSRFGFRQPNANRLHRVADINVNPPNRIEYAIGGNNNMTVDTKVREQIESEIKAKVEMQQRQLQAASADSNRNTTKMNMQKYTLQSNHLPRPQAVKLLESKTAKTLANNSKKHGGQQHLQHYQSQSLQDGQKLTNILKVQTDEKAAKLHNVQNLDNAQVQKMQQNQRGAGTSGDECYFTEDSGVGSNYGDQQIQKLEKSPLSRRIRGEKLQKPRTLEVVLTNNKFDVRDERATEEENKSDDTPVPKGVASSLTGLPSLPTLPPSMIVSKSGGYTSTFQQRLNTGLVRDRAADYQRNLIEKNTKELRQAARKNSLTSSEASSHGEDEHFKRIEKIAKFIKKPQKDHSKDGGSSSDEIWSSHVGEAMAEEFSSLCTSSTSSEDSKDAKDIPNLLEASIESLIVAKAHNRLSLIDPQFAAIARANIAEPLITDEPSPMGSTISSPLSESLTEKPDNDKTMEKSAASSNSKDVNEKNSASSPGSPTNASNSLSLSDGREDFLIDDEIADQPALLFDDTLTNNSAQQSETTPTIVDSTPKPARRQMGLYESSPLSLKSRRFGRGRAGSLDTLSPCESIASDDCMMDYDLSSEVESVNDRTETNSHFTLDDMPLRTVDLKITNVMRDWSSLLSGCDLGRDSSKRMSFRSSRLLKSRGGTPASSVPDSPRSTTETALRGSRTPLAASPLRVGSRSSTGTVGTGYDSDDSAVIRLDRTIIQDVMGIKTGLLRLKRVLHEQPNEDIMLRSETHNSLSENGFFNGFGSDLDKDPEEINLREETANLRRQVLYLQGQLEDSERTAHSLRQEIVSLSLKCETSQSAPASVTTTTTMSSSSSCSSSCTSTCNAATQTERIRPISAGPTLLQDAITDLSPGSLVSVSENNIKSPSTSSSSYRSMSRHATHFSSPKTVSNAATAAAMSPGRLWRMPGEPPAPSPIASRRSTSRTRIAHATLTMTSTTTTT